MSCGIRTGIAVCADIDDEEIFRQYGQLGAKLVLECAAPGLYGDQATRNWASGFNWWRGNCRDKLGQYAAGNGLVIAVSTQAGRTVEEDFPGGGYVFSPAGECIAETPDWSEGIFFADLHIL